MWNGTYLQVAIMVVGSPIKLLIRVAGDNLCVWGGPWCEIVARTPAWGSSIYRTLPLAGQRVFIPGFPNLNKASHHFAKSSVVAVVLMQIKEDSPTGWVEGVSPRVPN